MGELKLRDIFATDVTRNIPPVVYFHEQNPEKVADEVDEYIITGGYTADDPRSSRVSEGIHEQFVSLLSGIARAMAGPGRVELPASWISGFFGSGKSSFAKLLGLALDGVALPDGRLLSEALLSRDTSPRRAELAEAWEAATAAIDPMAVVFDIGAVARDNEHIHGAVQRMIQRRLGYCAGYPGVAAHELKLEQAGDYPRFVEAAEDLHGQPWSELKADPLADELYSEVLHEVYPERYTDPLSWFEHHAGRGAGAGASPAEVVADVAAMLEQRAPGKTLFVVVDEVSQFIHQDTDRMLRLQSFVEDLGQRLGGRVWLLATGQQKLEAIEDAADIGKLKDRFPARLRVHLSAANIRDVVHKRLLEKDAEHAEALRRQFASSRSRLKLYGYKCEDLTEADFMEVYPLLPEHIDLLMEITSNLRTRSTRIQGDDQAIRGLLQLLGEIFREQDLADAPVGTLITIDRMYDVQHTAFDVDVQRSMNKLLSHPEVVGDRLAQRAGKAVAMLELNAEREPVTSRLVAQCLYDTLGADDNEPQIRQRLEALRRLNLLSYSERTGYKVQSSAGQEWQRERDAHAVSSEAASDLMLDKLKALLGGAERPRWSNKPFPLEALYSDERAHHDTTVGRRHRDHAVLVVDVHLDPTGRRDMEDPRVLSSWVNKSTVAPYDHRLLWVATASGELMEVLRELGRSRHMIARYGDRLASLSLELKRVFFDEKGRQEELEKQAARLTEATLLAGDLFFRGRRLDPSPHATFARALKDAGEEVLPALYKHYVDVAVTPDELKQLLEPRLSGVSDVFLPGTGGLGILTHRDGRYQPDCPGQAPGRILAWIEGENTASGDLLLRHFGGPPSGYPPDVVKACVAGLLRKGAVAIQPSSGERVTSVIDPGARNLFTSDRAFKAAQLQLGKGDFPDRRTRNKLRRFFRAHFGADVDPDNEALVNAAFRYLPDQAARLQQLRARLTGAAPGVNLPPALEALEPALNACTRTNQVDPTLSALVEHLDALSGGVPRLEAADAALSDEALGDLARAHDALHIRAAQLRQVDQLAPVKGAADAVADALAAPAPWDHREALYDPVDDVHVHYMQVRGTLIQGYRGDVARYKARIESRDDFGGLKEHRANHVLLPLYKADVDLSPTATDPPLLYLRDTLPQTLDKALAAAEARYDEAIKENTGVATVPVKLSNLGQVELESEEDVDRFLQRLRERLLENLGPKKRVRIQW